MTWTSKAWGLVTRHVLDVEGVKVGLGGVTMTLKQHQTKLVRGYLTPYPCTTRKYGCNSLVPIH